MPQLYKFCEARLLFIQKDLNSSPINAFSGSLYMYQIKLKWKFLEIKV